MQSKFMPCEHGAVRRLWRSLSYNFHTYLVRRKEIVADLPWLGVSLRAGSEDMLGRRLFKTGMYEAGVTNFLLHYLSNVEQDVVFDVGANVGYYSVLTHRVCGDSVPVHAIEAEPENYRQLEHNLSRSNAGSVVPHFCAVSEEPGESKLYLWKSSNRGKHSLVPFEGAETVIVKTRTLDDVYRDEGLAGRTVSLLKIDIEGGEHGAFLGAQNMLKHCAVIASEVSPKFLKRAGLSLDAHIALVCDQGFEMFEICDDQTVKPCSVDDLRDSRKGRNVVYVRQDLLQEQWLADALKMPAVPKR